jgi:hypothetical protein
MFVEMLDQTAESESPSLTTVNPTTPLIMNELMPGINSEQECEGMEHYIVHRRILLTGQ